MADVRATLSHLVRAATTVFTPGCKSASEGKHCRAGILFTAGTEFASPAVLRSRTLARFKDADWLIIDFTSSLRADLLSPASTGGIARSNFGLMNQLASAAPAEAIAIVPVAVVVIVIALTRATLPQILGEAHTYLLAEVKNYELAF